LDVSRAAVNTPRSSSCARRSGSSRRTPYSCAPPSSCPKPQFRMFLLQQSRDRMSKRLRLLVAGFRINRNIDLQPFSTQRSSENSAAQSDRNLAYPKPHLRALQDIRWRSRIEIEHIMSALQCQRPALMTDAVRSKPGSRSKPARQIVGEYEMDRPPIAAAPNRAVFTQRAMHRRILFKEIFRSSPTPSG